MRLLACLAVVATTLSVLGVGPVGRAAADTPFTFVNEQFNEATFPPTGWTTPDGSWSSSCTVTSPETGCAAVAAPFSGGSAGLNELLFNPSVGIPANLQNVTLSFYSDFSPDATSSGDSVVVDQALVNTQSGDLNTIVNVETPVSHDALATPVLHTIALPNDNLPLAFRWQSFGDTSTTPTSSWAITNVMITGTLPATGYTLTANAIPNTTYPHIVAGSPVTITLSGSSNPTGDSLLFSIATPPTLGTLGQITQVDATHATVVYSSAALSCPNPNGVGTLICADPFYFSVHDLEGNVSAPAQVDIDVLPGGPAGEVPAISAPTQVPYETIVQNAQQVQAADLSAVSVGPAAFPDEMQLHLTASIGTIDLPNAAISGATFLNGTTNNEQQIYLAGSATHLKQAIGIFLFLPGVSNPPQATVSIDLTDLGADGYLNSPNGQTVTATVTVLANPVTPPAPSLTLPTGPLAIATNAGPLTFPAGATTGFTLTDAGATASTQDEVVLNVSGGSLALPAADTGGATQIVTAQSLGGGSSLDITGTVAHLQQALDDLTFDPSNLPSESVTLTAYASDPTTMETSPLNSSASITVTEAPFAFGTTAFSTLEGTPSTVWLCADGPPGHALTFTITATTTNGTLVADPAANPNFSGCSQSLGLEAFTYTPNAGFTGSDGFTYSVTDPTTGLVSAGNTVAITVTAHQKPTAFNVTALTTEDHAVTVTLCGQNPEAQATPSLTFTIMAAPQFGTLSDAGTPPLDPCNQGNVAHDFTYTPNAGTFKTDGTDGFTYDVSNGTFSDPATATITVTTLTPQVIGYSTSVNEDSSIGLNLCATTPNGPVTFNIATPPQHGTLDQGLGAGNGPACPSGYFNFGYERYVPTQLFSGTDTIGFDATDGTRTSSEAFIDLTVNKVEIPPTANPQSVTDLAPHAIAITLSGSSLQGSTLTFRVTGNPAHGALSGTAPNLMYTPSIANGTDSFTFVANDGVADSPPATVTIDVTTPNLSSSVCYAGAPVDPQFTQFACTGNLTNVDSPQFGVIELAHTSGTPNTELRLQQAITNESSASDTVTLTAPVGTSQWPLLYDEGGSDVTSQITGSGLTVTLGPVGSGTATVYVQMITFSPLQLPAPPVVSDHVLATSGNDPSVATSIPIQIQFGTSSPALSLAQANGSGAMAFPNTLQVSPPLYDGGPAGGVDILAGMATGGTGINTFTLQASPSPGNTPGVTANYYIGTTNVTAAVLAGTEVVTCYALPVGCPPLSATLTPGSSGSGYYTVEFTLTSTIDAQATLGFATVQLAGAVGPDLYTIQPDNGINVFEPTPVTQSVSRATELNGSSTQTVFLQNIADVPDTFSVHGAVTEAAGDTSVLSVAATAPGFYGSPGPSSNITGSITNGNYTVTIPAGDVVELLVTDVAGAATATASPQVIFTATSQLDPAKIDSYKVVFPTYFYRPDEILTRADGSQIGAGLYQQTYLGPLGNNQESEYNVGNSPTTIDVTLADNGQGPWPSNDNVVVTAPTVDPQFVVTYTLLQGSSATDVTAAMEGPGLHVSLGPPGSPEPVIAMSVKMSVSAQAGHPAYFPIQVTSSSSLPAGLADLVVVGLLTSGQSQLRFAGLPQPEPPQITQFVNTDGYTNRIAPFPDAGYAPGVTYGAYPDATGQKFAYVSSYDTFDLQVSASNLGPTSYRIQMVDPGTGLAGLPSWERAAFTFPYYNGRALDTPVDPLANGVTPIITAGGQDVTAQVENGTYTTAPLLTYQTSDITVSFTTPPASLLYTPLKFNLINATTGQIEDVMVVDPSSIVTCTPDGFQQQQATIKNSTGSHKLNFVAYDRVNPNSPTTCMQHLSHSWITTAPLVFGAYVDADPGTGTPAGGDNPKGLWMVPEPNTVLRVNTDTGTVTGNATGFVDSPMTDANGAAVVPTAANPYENWYYLGKYQNLNWNTADGTNGLQVGGDTLMPPSPFPLTTPSTADWPNNTMGAGRYFQVDGLDGAPVMVGEMAVNIPWFHGAVPLIMELGPNVGLTLNYPAPSGTVANLPSANGTSGLNFYNFYWNSTKNGTVTQGGCLGVPSEFWVYLGLSGGPNICILGATVSFSPTSAVVGAEMKVSQITVSLINVGLGVKASPEFNINSFAGEIDLDPASQDVTKVVLNPVFGVGPPTGCQEDQNLGLVTGLWKNLLYLPCPTNLFFFNAKITYQTGGFDTGYASPAGFGLQFSGTLSFLNIISISNIEADISTSPFNFHFGYSPVDVAISPSIPVSASLTFSGDIGAAGFSIDIKGQVIVAGVTIAGASGVLSSKGIGVCGTVAGISIGFGDFWGSSPQVYPSGCDTSQFDVGA